MMHPAPDARRPSGYVELPPVLTQPYLVTTASAVIVGPPDNSPILWQKEGPPVLFHPPEGGPFSYPYPELDGNGWLRLYDDAGGKLWWNLRKCRALNTLHGLTAITVEFRIRLLADAGNDRWIIGGYGSEFGGSSAGAGTATTGLRVSMQNRGLTFRVTTSTGVHTVTTANNVLTLDPADQVNGQHVACVFSQSGGWVRIFIDGVQVTTAAAGGTLRQEWYEALWLGYLWEGALTLNSVAPGPSAWIKHLKFTASAKYTTGFTPSTGNPNDGLWTENWATSAVGPALKYYSSTGDGWMVGEAAAYAPNTQTGCRLGDPGRILTFTGSQGMIPVYAVGAIGLEVYNVRCAGCYIGAIVSNNSYLVSMEGCEFTGGSDARYGIANSTAGGVNTFVRPELVGFQVPFAVSSSSVDMFGGWLVPHKTSVWLMGSSTGVEASFFGTKSSHEGIDKPDLHTLVGSSLKNLVWHGGGWDNAKAGNSAETLRWPSLAMRTGAQSSFRCAMSNIGGATPVQTGNYVADLSNCGT